MRRVLAATAAAVLSAVLVAACGRQSQPTAYNAADVTFLQSMLAHHESSAKLLTLGRVRSPRVSVLAMVATMEKARKVEVKAMTGWLREWGQPVAAAPGHAEHAGHDTGQHPMVGTADLTELAEIHTADFDVAFLNVLIGHQRHAVELARSGLASGAHPHATEMARRIEERIAADLRQMLQMVASIRRAPTPTGG